MNKKIIIKDLNRKRVPICELNKLLYIEDDIKLIDTLIEIADKGIADLRQAIVRDKFMYIIYCIQYLKIFSQRYPSENDKINSVIEKWIKRINLRLDDERTKKNKPYYLFLEEILKELEESFKQENEFKFIPNKQNEKKELSFEETINLIIKHSEDIDITKLNEAIHTSIPKYLSLNNERKQYDSIKIMINSLKNKLENADNKFRKNVITEIIKVLEPYYNEYYESSLKEYTELFDNYLATNYNDKNEVFNSWNIDLKKEEKQPYIITIDQLYSLDLDDAIGLSEDEYGMTLHIYIANTYPFLVQNPAYEKIAFERYSSLYFQRYNNQKSYHMLPIECAENLLSLKENEIRSVVDHAFYIDNLGNISYDMSYKNIVVNKRLTYDEVDEMIKNKSDSNLRDYLKSIEKAIEKIYIKEKLNITYSSYDISRAQKIVSKAAILVNQMIVKEATKKQYLLLYQDYFSSKYSISVPEHPYAKVTSPIRRYSDLKNNYLIKRFFEDSISESEYYKIEKELLSMLPVLEDRKERNKQFSKVGTLHLNQKI